MPYNYNGSCKRKIFENGVETGYYEECDYPTRHKEFMTEMTHICLDVDKNANSVVVQAVNDCKNYEFYLHTSNSATKVNQKFRIILPLENPIPAELLQDAKVYKEFILKFNVVGTIDLNEVTEKIQGVRKGINIFVTPNNINLIYEKILKSKKTKFRLISDSVVIYFEKDTVLYIEGSSKKIKLCDIEATGFNVKMLDN
jgi:hypothetical protein